MHRSELKHGDWIRAGDTDFHVYVEGFSQRDSRAMTPQKEAVCHLLRERRRELYAVVDAARSLRIHALLKESADAWQYLHEGHERERERNDSENVAPCLVKLSDAASPLLDSLVREGWGERWGVYVTSQRSFEDLCNHFRRFLMIDDPVGQPMTFRFYDPGVLRQELITSSSRWIEDVWFAGVSRFIVEWEGGREARILWARSGDGLMEEGVKL
ncbi:Hypothetical protein A7982_04219 [Minicystis rosea]|nr:Hypothetical protein A7982_04219 [Minicystis rosea]